MSVVIPVNSSYVNVKTNILFIQRKIQKSGGQRNKVLKYYVQCTKYYYFNENVYVEA